MTKELFKKEICNDPIIYTIDNFITQEQCQHFINISKDKIQPSLVSGEKKGYISQGRTGMNCWIKHDYDNITLQIANNIANLINIPIENAESFQVIYYDKTQEYKQHYDSWSFDNSEKSIRNMKYGGQRMVTALVYLNNVHRGGATRFTRLNKQVEPETGKLLVFHNVYNNSNIKHDLSEHAGMSVIEGEKWAFNLWFREKSRKVLYNYMSNKNT